MWSSCEWVTSVLSHCCSNLNTDQPFDYQVPFPDSDKGPSECIRCHTARHLIDLMIAAVSFFLDSIGRDLTVTAESGLAALRDPACHCLCLRSCLTEFISAEKRLSFLLRQPSFAAAIRPHRSLASQQRQFSESHPLWGYTAASLHGIF